jgi:arginine/lysine/ornithine decarboxylase
MPDTLAPFLDEIEHLAGTPATSFHMPGHRHGGGRDAIESGWLRALLPFDQSETGRLDYLHQPTGPLQEAQQHAARLFHAEESFFLVGGATAGNLAALLAVHSPGRAVVVERAAHCSVLAALVLSGAVPRYVHNRVDETTGIVLPCSTPQFLAAFAGDVEAAAVHVTAPTYLGLQGDLSALCPAAHDRGLTVVVDEAHGGHFGLHADFPPPALIHGADAAIHGAHKTLGALTQAGLLHVQGTRIDRRRLFDLLSMVQSSSPSAILTGSLDETCRRLSERGGELFHHAVLLAEQAREEIDAVPGLRCYGASELCELPGVAAADPTKLIVASEDAAEIGPALRSLLLEDAVEPELHGPKYVVFTISYADTRETVSRLVQSLERAAGSLRAAPPRSCDAPRTVEPEPAVLAMTPRDAFFSSSRRVDLSASVGEVAAAPVIPYPPGIPLLLPGETIASGAVDYLAELARQDARILGLHETDGDLTLSIVAA